MPPDAQAADNTNTPNPNELDTELTPEQEQAFVNSELGIAGSVTQNEPQQTNTQPNDAGTDGAGGANLPTPPEAPAQSQQPPEAPQTPEAPVEPPVAPELVTEDLWVETERAVTDAEGNVTFETVKLVYDPEDPESFLPEGFTFKDDRQLYQILDAKNEMARIYNERQSEYTKALEDIQATQTVQQQNEQQLAAWDQEIEDLVADGFLEAPKTQVGQEGWEKDPSVQKIDAVFKFMDEANKNRMDLGLPPFKSFAQVYHKFEKQEQARAQEAQQVAKVAEVKQKGAMIGGSSAASGGSSQPTYKAGGYSNIWEIPVEGEL